MIRKPNIIFFLVDDMGYGDVSCLNPEGKIKTPNFDRLAQEGMKFTDAHSAAAICSPSRYSVLTGRYCWRSCLQKGIVWMYGDPIISQDRLTVPKYLHQNGYHTACIGKWHLGMGWDFEVNKDFFLDKAEYNDLVPPYANMEASEEQKSLWRDAFSKPVTGGPIAAGFDYYFGVDVPNWPPYCFIENDRTVGIPSEWIRHGLIGNFMGSAHGPAVPYWNFEQLLPTFAMKADRYIQERAQNNTPFFLYLPMTSPHTPLAVNKQWIGKSGLDNLYADFVMETDDIFGQIMDSLKRYGIDDNTLVIFTSDNGCDINSTRPSQLEAQGHYPSYHFRGYKSDAWDGGHRMPFIARWPGVISAGNQCDQLICLTDFMATCSSILGQELPDNAGEDSASLMPIFNNSDTIIHDYIVHHSAQGKFAIRDKQWKLVLCPGSGGGSKNDAEAFREGLPLIQLYNIDSDPSEKINLYKKYPERVKAMIAVLTKIVDDGRSNPGLKQCNDVPVDIWKLDTMPGADITLLTDY